MFAGGLQAGEGAEGSGDRSVSVSADRDAQFADGHETLWSEPEPSRDS